MRLACLLPLMTALASTNASADELVMTSGATGLLHLPSAHTSPAGTLQGALFVDLYTYAGFLCTKDHPCGSVTRDVHRHTGATAVVNATLVPGLETYLTGRTYVNDNSQSPEVLQVIGDTTLGAKYARALGDAVSLGGTFDVLFAGASGSSGFTLSGTSLRARALSTFTIRRIRWHIGLGYVFDNSAALVRDVEASRGRAITRVERQGLAINRADRIEVSVGEDLGDSVIRPFGEIALSIPVRRQGYVCAGADDPCGSAWPVRATIGVRWLPFLREHSSLWTMAALDTSTTQYVSELAPQPAYTFWLAVGFVLGTSEPAPRILLQKVDVETPVPSVTIRGLVHVAHTQTPIADAIVSYIGAKRSQLSTDPGGHFGDEVPPGTYELRVRAPGFAENVCGGTAIYVKGKPNVLTLDCPLEPLVTP